MAKRDEIKKQIEQQQNDVYGEGTMAGSSPDPEADDEILDTIREKSDSGNINPADEFHLADDVMASTPTLPMSDDEEESEEEALTAEDILSEDQDED